MAGVVNRAAASKTFKFTTFSRAAISVMTRLKT
jgi:hypothetical protein